jgi:hypothetical protein
VNIATGDKIILHDADMLVVDGYTSEIYEILNRYDSCHIGKYVLYTSMAAADNINNLGYVDSESAIERVVEYYEGGSLAIKKDTYWGIGGFNEDYDGYGCEDCDFFSRMKSTNMLDDRKHVLLHLWHPRAEGWDSHHIKNKELEHSLSAKPTEERIRLQQEQIKRLRYNENTPT